MLASTVQLASSGGGGSSGSVISGLVHTFTSLVTGILGLGGSAAKSIVGDSVEDIAKAILGLIGSWVSDGAVWLLDQVGAVINSTTGVDLNSSWFGARFALMTELAGVVVLPMLLFAVIQAIYRQSAAALLRAFLVNLPLVFVVTGVAVELLQIGMAVTDSMSSTFLSAAGVDTHSVLKPIGVALAGIATAAPGFVCVLVGFLVSGVALVLWLELVIRATAITAAAMFLPLVLAGLVWPATSHWARRLAETLTSLVLSKLVIVAIISLASGALNGGVTGSGSVGTRFGEVVTGIALLFLATLSPFVLMRLIPIVEGGAISHLDGARNRMRQSAEGAIGAPRDIAMMLAKGSSGTGAAAGAGTAAAAGAGTAAAVGAAAKVGTTARESPVGMVDTNERKPSSEQYDDQMDDLAPIGQRLTGKTPQGTDEEQDSA